MKSLKSTEINPIMGKIITQCKILLDGMIAYKELLSDLPSRPDLNQGKNRPTIFFNHRIVVSVSVEEAGWGQMHIVRKYVAALIGKSLATCFLVFTHLASWKIFDLAKNISF